MVVTVGGTIPADDIPELKKLGVAEVFTPGAGTDEIVEFVQRAVGAHEARLELVAVARAVVLFGGIGLGLSARSR